MNRYAWLLVAACGLAWGSGCGEDDDEDSAGSTPINQLTAAQAKSACNSLKARFDRLAQASVKIGCTESALEETSCDDLRAACIRSTEPDPEDDIDCNSDASAVEDMDCAATLAEVQACLESYVSAVESLAARYTCDSEAPEPPGQPAACAKIEATCPDFGSIGTE